MADDNGEKTHEPTQRKLDDARAKGQVARSGELSPALAFLSVATVAGMINADQIRRPFYALGRHIVDAPQREMDLTIFTNLFVECAISWAPLFLMLLGAAAAGSLAAQMLQGGPHPTSDPLKLDPSKMNPLSKIKSLVSLKHAWEATRALIAGSVAIWIVSSAMRDQVAELPGLLLLRAPALGTRLSEIVIGITWRAGLGLAILGALDLFISYQLYIKNLRMSREDLKQESKEQEGRPEVKGRRRRRMLELVRSGSIQSVRTADVVVTNPTHYAVALAYNKVAMGAPRVVAKGRDRTAQRIRLEAVKYGIPIVENPPLARELYAKVAVDREVPHDLYRAVAEVIAFVMRLKAAVDPTRIGGPPSPQRATGVTP